MLSVAEARKRICEAVPALGTETIPLSEADGRVLAVDVESSRALPPHDNSAMDGFAVRASELPGTLPVAGIIAAGDAPDAVLPPGAVLRIMTGAPVPDGADSIVMRENVDDHGDTATFADAAILARHVRKRGEDVAVGDVVLTRGTALGPGEIGLLAALGSANVEVARRPRVALFSTGDELVDVSVEPAPGQIVNSNAYALAAQVREAGGVVVSSVIAPDDRDTLVSMLRESLEGADLLCSSGGVSVGDFDFVKEAFETVGVSMEFWKVAMKPGKPLAYGRTAAGTPVFGLPGNPVSSMVSFELFARPALRSMQGASVVARPTTAVTIQHDYAKKPGRAHFVRATVTRTPEGLVATTKAKQGSGMLTSMVGVDVLIEVPVDRGDISAGETLSAIVLRPA
jgi:molybdopterin molybdotransferase